MTLEEYLNNGVELEEMAMAHFERPSEDEEQRKIALAYSEGRRDVFKETLEKLSTFNYEATIREVKEMEHEVTLREVKEFCRVHKRESKEFNVCKGCALYFYEECLMKVPPRYLKTDEIERRMKEARND